MRVSLTIAAALLPVVALGTSARADATGRYVALGDSFVAGPFIPDQRGLPRGCLRSDHNYPSLVAARLKTTVLVDVSCSGAKTADMAAAQRVPFGWQNAPQLDALTPATTLVTLGVGGNDIGFTDIAISCGTLGLLNPVGAPCAKRFSHDLDQRIAATGPKVAAVLQAIHQRAPRARVLVVGYPRLLPSGGGCWPAIPLGPADTVYLDGVERDLNGMLRAQAVAGGAEFVDAYAGGNGHDMCADARQRWVEGVLPAAPAAPLHLNARGMRVVAARVLAVLSRPRLLPAPGNAVLFATGSAPAQSVNGGAPVLPAPAKAVPVLEKGPILTSSAKGPALTTPERVRVLPVAGRAPVLAGKGPVLAAGGKGPAPATPGKVSVLPAPRKLRGLTTPGR
jgi:lysophospholipase L1-like esterase